MLVRFDSQALASALLAAPWWARLGLAAPDQRLQLRAATELADSLIECVEASNAEPDSTEADADQLRLAI